MDPEMRERCLARIEEMKSCRLCPAVSKDPIAAGQHFYQKHQRNAANKLYTCPLCNQEYRSIFKHFELHHPDNCEFCLGGPPFENHGVCQYVVNKAHGKWLENIILRFHS